VTESVSKAFYGIDMATIKLKTFTNRAIEKIPIPDKGVTLVVPDEKRPQIGVSITKTGTRTFHYRVSINGRGQRIAIPNGNLQIMSVSEARKLAPALIADALKGITPASKKLQHKVETITLREVADDYLNHQMKKLDKPMKETTALDYESRLKLSFDDYLDKPISLIDEDVIKTVMEARGKRCLSALRVLKAIINHAGLNNPVPAKLASYGRKQTYLKEAYFPDWFKALQKLNPSAREYYLFLLLTGVRADTEASSLTWDRIDWKAKSFILTDTKNHSDVELPLPSYLIPMLKKRQSEGLVFPDGEYRAEREFIINEINYHFTRHDLRRTFLTIAEGIDVSWLSVKRLANHKSQESDVTVGYVVVSLERLRKASILIESEILRLFNGC